MLKKYKILTLVHINMPQGILHNEAHINKACIADNISLLEIICIMIFRHKDLRAGV